MAALGRRSKSRLNAQKIRYDIKPKRTEEFQRRNGDTSDAYVRMQAFAA